MVRIPDLSSHQPFRLERTKRQIQMLKLPIKLTHFRRIRKPQKPRTVRQATRSVELHRQRVQDPVRRRHVPGQGCRHPRHVPGLPGARLRRGRRRRGLQAGCPHQGLDQWVRVKTLNIPVLVTWARLRGFFASLCNQECRLFIKLVLGR